MQSNKYSTKIETNRYGGSEDNSSSFDVGLGGQASLAVTMIDETSVITCSYGG